MTEHQIIEKETETSRNYDLDIFNILEDKDGSSRWIKIGVAFVNKDGSINAFLDVLPRDVKLQIRERRKN